MTTYIGIKLRIYLKIKILKIKYYSKALKAKEKNENKIIL